MPYALQGVTDWPEMFDEPGSDDSKAWFASMMKDCDQRLFNFAPKAIAPTRILLSLHIRLEARLAATNEEHPRPQRIEFPHVTEVALGIDGSAGFILGGRLGARYGPARSATVAMVVSGTCCLCSVLVFGLHPVVLLRSSPYGRAWSRTPRSSLPPCRMPSTGDSSKWRSPHGPPLVSHPRLSPSRACRSWRKPSDGERGRWCSGGRYGNSWTFWVGICAGRRVLKQGTWSAPAPQGSCPTGCGTTSLTGRPQSLPTIHVHELPNRWGGGSWE